MEGKGQNQLTGTVSHVIFQNKENGYTVLRLKTGQEEVTAVGILPQVTQGEQVILEGSWTDHPNFGGTSPAADAQRETGHLSVLSVRRHQGHWSQAG